MSDGYVFTYCLDIGEREFQVFVTDDRMIHWDDYTQRRKQRNEKEQLLEMRTILGEEFARRRLRNEMDNFTISFLLTDELFDRMKEARRLLDADQWENADEEKLDPVLKEIFWKQVNPFLNPQVQRDSV